MQPTPIPLLKVAGYGQGCLSLLLFAFDVSLSLCSLVYLNWLSAKSLVGKSRASQLTLTTLPNIYAFIPNNHSRLIPTMPPTRRTRSSPSRTTPTRPKGAETTSSSTTAKVDLDSLLFSSELIKITLTDPNECLPIGITQDPTESGTDSDLEEPIAASTAHNSGTVFHVHKGILVPLSPELAKHIENHTKEGFEEVALGGVDTSTMQWFLQWAYRGGCKLYVLPISM